MWTVAVPTPDGLTGGEQLGAGAQDPADAVEPVTGAAAVLERHEHAQALERERVGTAWAKGGWMFARLHDARHTAATVLLLLGIPEPTVTEFMGWSNSAMAKRYQHVMASMRRDVAQRLSGRLWARN